MEGAAVAMTFDIDVETWRMAGNAVRTNYYRNGGIK